MAITSASAVTKNAQSGEWIQEKSHVVAFTVNETHKGRRNTEAGMQPIPGGPAGVRPKSIVARKLCVLGFHQVCPVSLKP